MCQRAQLCPKKDLSSLVKLVIAFVGRYSDFDSDTNTYMKESGAPDGSTGFW